MRGRRHAPLRQRHATCLEAFMILNLAPIVEGDGDDGAVPVLLRRISQSLQPELFVNVRRPVRVGRYKLVKPDGRVDRDALERSLRLGMAKVQPPRALIVLVDADTDCPAELGPSILECARAFGLRIPIGVVLAKHEYEAWFLAALESLRGKRGLREDVEPPPDPESVRDAKGFLTRHMTGTQAYNPARDQPALTALFDMQLARHRSDSFDKCWREVRRLLETASGDA